MINSREISSMIRLTGAALIMAAMSVTVSASKFQQSKSELDRALQRLSTYEELKTKLTRLERYSRKRVNVGPLIDNGNNQGLVDIDIPLDSNLPINVDVCGDAIEAPTIRQAVICSVNDGGRGNLDADNIGFSTQGRALLAAQLGNPEGSKVMIITQQHGNEPAGTEAAVDIMRWLMFSRGKTSRQILSELNILVLVRANPDGGEPDAENCVIDPGVGEVISHDCGLIRQNVDATAGGSFLENSEADFSGIVGRGYDLNRYHYVGLEQPIRPVENQAMVAAVLAFQPKVILDLHGDVQKTDCPLDYASINTGQVLGLLPTAECLEPDVKDNVRILSPFADAMPNTEQDFLAQSLAVKVMQKAEKTFTGSVGRFSQVQLGSGNIGNGATGAYQQIGIAAGGWETANYSVELRADIVAVVNGAPVVSVNPGLPDPRLLRKQIHINRVVLFEALATLAEYTETPPIDGNGFCDYPYASGLFVNLPERYWQLAATPGTVMVPIDPLIGVPLFKSGNCPDN